MASPQQQQQSSAHQNSAFFLNDFVSLPIIITDFDAESSISSKKSDEQTLPSTAASETSSHPGEPSSQKWSTGFNDFADEMWRSMTEAMRNKLREAAVEVLKRTDDMKPGSELWRGEWDEDARFLD